ncbi:Acyl-CoA oxidase/dehydrogenase middle domain-containing protein [Pararobbsia alpina]|uniref:acyl-CoA dehydrogenase family protein n=1 Tax=Pararobbsia alpina TaxID=621374 RepID=UPI0039A6BB8F
MNQRAVIFGDRAERSWRALDARALRPDSAAADEQADGACDASVSENEIASRLDARLGLALEALVFDAGVPSEVGSALSSLVEQGLDVLPRPAHGQTLARWRALSRVAQRDLGLVKLYEGHTDALAVLDELGSDIPTKSRWGVFAAEAPDFQARAMFDDPLSHASGSPVTLHGAKAWCSGAQALTHALITCRDNERGHRLVALALDQPGVRISTSNWHAVGMAATASADMTFDHARGWVVGEPDAYLSRCGFWHGGAGIAACWYGGALRLAKAVAAAVRRTPDAHRSAHLGAIDVALRGAASGLRDAAAWIDAHSEEDAMHVVLRTRLLVEQAATSVIEHAGRSLGAGPLCRDADIARCMADLPVFLRQSHAERDLAMLGELHARERNDDAQWCL